MPVHMPRDIYNNITLSQSVKMCLFVDHKLLVVDCNELKIAKNNRILNGAKLHLRCIAAQLIVTIYILTTN